MNAFDKACSEIAHHDQIAQMNLAEIKARATLFEKVRHNSKLQIERFL